MQGLATRLARRLNRAARRRGKFFADRYHAHVLRTPTADADGEYVRRYVPELAAVGGGAIHEPWRLPEELRRTLDYPAPIVDHRDAIAEYRARLAKT